MPTSVNHIRHSSELERIFNTYVSICVYMASSKGFRCAFSIETLLAYNHCSFGVLYNIVLSVLKLN